MITHFAKLELYTLSFSVVRLVYHERLRFPILAETDKSLASCHQPAGAWRYASVSFSKSRPGK
jgi:hypothetical protein